MGKKLGHIAQLICFKTMNHRVLLNKGLLKIFLVHFVDHTESLPQKTVITKICPLLTAAFQEHNAQLHLHKPNEEND
jgi:hypothetical protein